MSGFWRIPMQPGSFCHRLFRDMLLCRGEYKVKRAHADGKLARAAF
jgi:hypothetical protein